MRATAVALCVLAGGCIGPRAFPCEGDGVCVLDGVRGTCELDEGFCSYPDQACESGKRFEPRAGGGVAGQCTTPMEVESCDWQSVEGGELHTCALAPDRVPWCWGANFDGQLGIGSTTSFRPDPLPIEPAIATDTIVSAEHTCILSSGEVYCWGKNDSGQADPLTIPDAVLAPRRVNVPIIADFIVVGGKQSCVASEARAICWGELSTEASPFFEFDLPGSLHDVATGRGHVCAVLAADRSVHCLGDNGLGQLGVGGGVPSTNQLLPVDVGAPAVAIAAGQTHTCAITQAPGDVDRKVVCWGDNAEFKAGSVVGEIVWTPAEVAGDLLPGDWQKIAASKGHSCALNGAGEIYCWGGNSWGRADPAPATVWDGVARRIELDGFEPFVAQDVAAGTTTTCAVGVDGRWLCWGCSSPWTLPDLEGESEACPAATGTIRELGCALE